jgi:two-component system, NarL family, nitrate/nitrite response regulator NarL
MDAIIEIGVIDDDQMLLQGMAAWIANTGDIKLVAMTTSVEEYLAAPRTPKIVILDLNLGNYTDPVRNVAQLVDSGLQVIVASVIPDRAYIAATTEAGAAAYITKNNNLDTLANVVRTIHRGELPTTPEHAFWLSRDNRPRRPHLSPRERQILTAVGNGTPHKAIARQLGISISTVQTHLERVRYKYASVGRPIDHAGHYSDRLREDNLGRDGLPAPEPEVPRGRPN